MCNICKFAYHQQCTAIPAKAFDKLLTIVSVTGWACDDCKESAKTTVNRMQVAITLLSEEIAKMKQSISEIHATEHQAARSHEPPMMSGQVPSEPPRSGSEIMYVKRVTREKADGRLDSASTALIVHRTLQDVSRRKQNVIVSRLSECGDDRLSFLNLCEANLSVKLLVADRDCIRVGKKASNKPRLLLVRLRSEDTAAAILHAAPFLRKLSDAHVAVCT
jgi:hypothetical protein